MRQLVLPGTRGRWSPVPQTGKPPKYSDSLPWLGQGGTLQEEAGPAFLPSVATNLHTHPAINPSILGFSDCQQPVEERCFILLSVNIFTFYEHAGLWLLNTHIFSISWYLAILWDCPQSPLNLKSIRQRLHYSRRNYHSWEVTSAIGLHLASAWHHCFISKAGEA